MSNLTTNDFDLSDNILTVPTIDGNNSYKVNLTVINNACNVIEEIKTANVDTLPRLIGTFTLAMTNLTNIIAGVEAQLSKCERELDWKRSIFFIESAEGYLLSKGIKSTADAREAAVTIQPEVMMATVIRDQTKAALSFLTNKKKDLDSAYTGCKKIADLKARDMMGGRITSGGERD